MYAMQCDAMSDFFFERKCSFLFSHFSLLHRLFICAPDVSHLSRLPTLYPVNCPTDCGPDRLDDSSGGTRLGRQAQPPSVDDGGRAFGRARGPPLLQYHSSPRQPRQEDGSLEARSDRIP